MKTIFKWQGNKSKHFKYILPELPSQYNTYIEEEITATKMNYSLKTIKVKN